MFPEKHFKDLESSERRRKVLQHLGISSFFLGSFLLLGPLIHELAHILPLEIADCSYHVDLNFQLLSGVYAGVQPLCYPSSSFLALFYSAGYLSTLLAGWGMIIASHRAETGFDRYVAASGTGMLLSILLSIGSKGDVESFLSVAGIDQGLGAPVSVVFILVVLLVSFSGVEMLLED